MGEGEHTIIGKIPRERLNQIASRKLSALGIPVRLGADRETLEGEIAFGGRIHNPATGQPIARARFVVSGHDHLRFLDPPIAALGPVNFYGHDRTAALEQAISLALSARAAALQDIAARMRAIRLEPSVDPDRLAVRAVVKTPSHAFELLADPEGVRVSRVAPVGGAPFDVDPSFPAIDLSRFATLAAIEAFLSDSARSMAAARGPRPGAPAGSGAVEATPPPRNALTLSALADAFGSEAILAPNAMVELLQEFQHGGTRYRFVASREMGTGFKGRLIGPSGDVWSERFDLAEFPGTREIVARALGVGGEGAAPAAGAGLLDPRPHVVPKPGEVWVMNVVVERGGPDEVRYVGTDIDGRPYGAARVLRRADFEAVFAQAGGVWRLLVQIDQVQDGSVIYRQLDRARQPIGAPRKMSAAILVANFVPEAAAPG
ncbi:MAG TPA: hypothetical protein VLT61_03370 [Anaeromyxobacteraceae bacterium]|nr:hypothetical protein [Anaeromyxobacteraceae bacterium]